MHILIFQSAPEASQKATAAIPGGSDNETAFTTALQACQPSVETYTLNVADGEKLPQGMGLADFDGVVITGSPLSVYDDVPAVRDQLALARDVFEAGIPIFGSCFGLQLMSAALGGTVRLNPRGREIGIARTIQLNDVGRAHALYRNKPHAFAAICSHQDEVSVLPSGSTVLASNAVSNIQAAEISRGGCSFWGVQYHPEFDFGMIAALIEKRGQRHVSEGLARDGNAVAAIVAEFRALQADPLGRKDLAWRLGLEADVLDPQIRRAEFANWLDAKVKPYITTRSA